MKPVRPQPISLRRARRRGAVSSTMEEILILSLIVPASWIFFRFVVWWTSVIFHVVAPLVQWAYL